MTFSTKATELRRYVKYSQNLQNSQEIENRAQNRGKVTVDFTVGSENTYSKTHSKIAENRAQNKVTVGSVGSASILRNIRNPTADSSSTTTIPTTAKTGLKLTESEVILGASIRSHLQKSIKPEELEAILAEEKAQQSIVITAEDIALAKKKRIEALSWSGSKWLCKNCRQSGDRFYMVAHRCSFSRTTNIKTRLKLMSTMNVDLDYKLRLRQVQRLTDNSKGVCN